MKDLFSDNPLIKPDPKDFTIIDFGIGKLAVKVEPGSSIVINELVHALQEKAMVTPLQRIVNGINKM